MSKHIARALWLTVGLALCMAAHAAADDGLTAEAEGTGRAVLGFLGPEVSVDVRARVTLSGVLTVGDIAVRFSAEANAVGSGKGNSSTLEAAGWVALRGEGTTEAGAALTLTGGISVDALAPGASSTGGEGTGRFYLLLSTATDRWVIEGEARGSATGAFVPPADPHTMEVAGEGAFTLSGEARPWSALPGADLPAWPAMLLAELAREAALAAGPSGKD